MESVERQVGVRDPKLDLPPLPDHCAHIWYWFLDLSAARSSNGFGPNPLGYAEIMAYFFITGQQIRPSEVRALISLDMDWMDYQAKHQVKKPQPQKNLGKQKR